MSTATEPLPDAVQALLDDLKHRSRRDPDLHLTEADESIIRALWHGQRLEDIGDALGIRKQSVSRRRGAIRNTLQLYFIAETLDGAELLAYKALYLRIRGNPHDQHDTP